MTEEHKQKIRQTHLRLAHGEGWTEEDQEKFVRARNRRQCLNHRNKHREEYTRLPEYLSKEIQSTESILLWLETILTITPGMWFIL
jgi:hypothetical protein